MKKNRGAAFGRPLCVSIVLHFVVVAVGFASLSALPGTASSGLSLRLRTSAPCVSAKAGAAAGPLADADADKSLTSSSWAESL